MMQPSRLYPLAPAAGLLAALLAAAPARADVVTLVADRDNTLVEDPAGALANGAGPHFFSGRTGSAASSRRRALVHFDMAAVVPAGSVVTRATLTLHMSQTNAGAVVLGIHPLEADWGEGASQATGGGGAPAEPGDATWIHAFYDDRLWAREGGDFAVPASASLAVDQAGFYAWGPTDALLSDVQRWVDDPAANFGWLLLGDESAPTTVKRFDSREHAEVGRRPRLEVEFAPPCAPRFAGPGYWRRQCAAGSLDGEGASEPPGEGAGPDESGFEERVLPCARELLAGLGVLQSDACATVAPEPPVDCRANASRKLATLAFNLCAGRLQTSCPAQRRSAGCPAGSLGELIVVLAERLLHGDCRAAVRCADFGD